MNSFLSNASLHLISEEGVSLMVEEEYQEFPCDLCGEVDAVEVPHCREYTGGQPIHICTQCGFVYVKMRRSAKAIADTWSDALFGNLYSASTPLQKSRFTYVLEFMQNSLGLKDKVLCDIGAGEGLFLKAILQGNYGALVMGIEPSKRNCERLAQMEVECFNGTIEEFCKREGSKGQRVDIVTMLWTLENCQSSRAMLAGAHQMLNDGGHIVVATGSRILVPFKKPLDHYLSTNHADTHAFRFSCNTLRALLAVTGFEVVDTNLYIDHDVLCMIAKKVSHANSVSWKGDHYLDVCNYFERWHVETKMYYNLQSRHYQR